jgi:hypothetical protein
VWFAVTPLPTPLDLNLAARLLYKTLAERIGDNQELRGELEAAFDILDLLVDKVEEPE